MFDSLYQACFINACKNISVIIPKEHVKSVNKVLNTFNIDIKSISLYNIEDYIDDDAELYKKTIESKSEYFTNFRNSFWIYTTMRFFILKTFIEKHELENVFHIENDVMLYISCDKIYSTLDKNSMYCVKDAVNRVVPSILFFPNTKSINNLTSYILEIIQGTKDFINDMNLLGSYVHTRYFPIEPETNDIIYDGACIGQYLGGIDPRNNNGIVSPGFLNETSIINPSNYIYLD